VYSKFLRTSDLSPIPQAEIDAEWMNENMPVLEGLDLMDMMAISH
jgi:hypothetical protein